MVELLKDVIESKDRQMTDPAHVLRMQAWIWEALMEEERDQQEMEDE
jgi:hypothetical protein